jgi:hypothetical protein
MNRSWENASSYEKWGAPGSAGRLQRAGHNREYRGGIRQKPETYPLGHDDSKVRRITAKDAKDSKGKAVLVLEPPMNAD